MRTKNYKVVDSREDLKRYIILDENGVEKGSFTVAESERAINVLHFKISKESFKEIFSAYVKASKKPVLFMDSNAVDYEITVMLQEMGATYCEEGAEGALWLNARVYKLTNE